MDDQFQQYCKINESKNIFKSARTPITLFIVLAVAYVAHVSFFCFAIEYSIFGVGSLIDI